MLSVITLGGSAWWVDNLGEKIYLLTKKMQLLKNKKMLTIKKVLLRLRLRVSLSMASISFINK